MITPEEAKYLSSKRTMELNNFQQDSKTGEYISTEQITIPTEHIERYMKEEKNVVVQDFEKQLKKAFDKKAIAEHIIEMQPCWYDKARNWWLWNWQEKKWERTDETEILIAVERQANINTINSKERNEIIEALKQVSRLNAPSPIKPTWIQFKDTIVDIKTGERFQAMPHWFVTNPIPYELHESDFEITPTIDRIFEEWVGKDYVKTLYEIIAYCMLPDYPVHRLFCFVGAGMNGKSKFLELLRKFIGNDNCCSTELDTLMTSRFEVTRLHKKLVCQMGETNFGEISKTSMLKKLTGGDLIGYEYKGKDPFEDKNYAKILISTNNLPVTTDKTVGFYRRWMIIDFPNQFGEKKDILLEIPEEEYKCLALKSITILKELIEKREFFMEGSIDQRMERYEAKSNFFEKFIEISTEFDSEGYILKSDFSKKVNIWCKENRHREMSDIAINHEMKRSGYESITKWLDWFNGGKGGSAKVWAGIKWK